MKDCDRFNTCMSINCHACQVSSSSVDPYPYYISRDGCDKQHGTINKKDNANNIDIHRIIDEAMEKKDRMVTIFISEVGTTVSVQPIGESPHWTVEPDDENPNRNIFVCSECSTQSTFPGIYCSACGEKMNGCKEKENEQS